MAETYNLIQTLQKLRDDLQHWSRLNFQNVLSKLTTHQSDSSAHSGEFAKYMTLASFATEDPANGKVDHAVYADTTNQADNAAKLGGTDASAYAKTADLDFAARVHKHAISDLNTPSTNPEDGSRFILTAPGSSGSAE